MISYTLAAAFGSKYINEVIQSNKNNKNLVYANL